MSQHTGERAWVYPAWVKGPFQNMRKVSFGVLWVLLLVTPWIQVSGHPLARLDLGSRRMFVLDSIFTAQETIFLVLVLLFLAFALFFVTSLFGRIWCGYACPQTVFLETFVHPIERFIEGTRGKRMALDRGKWTANKVGKKLAKWTIFMVVSVVVSMTFVSWFTGAIPLWTGQASGAAYGAVAAFSGVMFLDLAWFREQFCNFLCPYARFQGVIAGPNSLIIGYDVPRGEPRREKGLAKNLQGDCIDCNRCVAVCPTGIDIRDGYQLECIGCARCVDACELIMEKFNKPTLVRYSTEVEDQGGERKLLRPRPAIYALLMAASALVFVQLMAQRHTLDVNLNRAPGSLFMVDEDGYTRNTFMLSVSSKQATDDPAPLEVQVNGLPLGTDVRAPSFSVASGETVQAPLIIRTPPGQAIERTVRFDVKVSAPFDAVTVPATFKTGTEINGAR